MPTEFQVHFTEQSKCVVSTTKVKSDELSAEQVLEKAEDLALKALDSAATMTMDNK